MECQIKHRTPNRMSLLRKPCLFSFGKNPNQTSDTAIKNAAKHQRSDKPLKIKYKAFEMTLPTRILFHFLVCP